MPDIRNYENPRERVNERSAGGDGRGITLGSKASAEQFAPRPLVEFAVAAERLGLDSVAVSDHLQPWRHTTCHARSPSVGWRPPAAAGERTERIALGLRQVRAVGPGLHGRDPSDIDRLIEIKVSYDHDADDARDACRLVGGAGAEDRGEDRHRRRR